ncbi:hypothetical protein [Algivirga pacifica]|uniref:Rod shape-determining protein MreD n=1 Tax=Algivirga pacifica TaxID=1162670 RepID=A0ABP9D917_9BACT
MVGSVIGRLVALFFVLILLQGIFLRNFALFDYALLYPYVALILILPFGIRNMTALFMSFFLGLIVDVFYDTLGMHAAACVLMAFARIYILKLMSKEEQADDLTTLPSVSSRGFQWFALYAFILVSVHHVGLFALEYFNTRLFLSALLRGVASATFTVTVIVSVQYIFGGARKTRFRSS